MKKMTPRQIASQKRQIAIQNGDKTFEGRPCKKEGHTKRYTSNNKCIECHKQYVKRPEQIDQGLKRNYGITSKDWIGMYEEQNGICGNPYCDFTNHPRWWEQERNGFCVDHDHNTGEVRGLLCSECNKQLGQIDKHPRRLMGLIQYKREWDESQQKKVTNFSSLL